MPEYGIDPVRRESCGTYAGWNQHHRQGERACRPCLDAAARYQRERRKRGRCQSGHPRSR